MARSSVFAWYRWVIIGVLALMAAAAFMHLRGPDEWQRLYYRLPEEHIALIATSAERHKVNPYLVAAIIHAESSWESDAVSSAGAVGLMQILPSTAGDLDHLVAVDPDPTAAELKDPATNIEFGTAYFRFLVERYHEIEPALAAYNAGLRHVDDWVVEGDDIRDAIRFPETRHYVLRVVRAQEAYERLYPDAFDAGR